MYQDSYWLYSEDRAIGQHLPKGYSMQGRYPAFETPETMRSYFQNRAVGQHAMPMAPSDFFGVFDVLPGPAFSSGPNGWIPPGEPINSPTVPTTIYTDTDEAVDNVPPPATQPPATIGLPFGMRAHHALILVTLASILLILIIKK